MGEPRRVAIVGAGPSGIFAAQALLAHPGIAVDLYDRLPSPYGLLRYGVAPDHTSIKGVGDALARVFESPDICLLYTSDAADDLPCVDLGGRRIIKTKKRRSTGCTAYTYPSKNTCILEI